MRKEYDLRSMKVKRRGQLPGFEEGGERTTKGRITIALDQDLIAHFKGEAAKPGGLPYQTQINQALREYITRQSMKSEAETEDLKASLLDDPEFIAALARKLEIA